MMKHWSLPEVDPRPAQIRIINEISDVIDSYTNIIVEAGTGIGKSAIATTVAGSVDSTYILTMTTQLQQQYLHDFSNLLYNIKGRSHYTCRKNGRDCENGSCQLFPDEKHCGNCPYTVARETASLMPITLSNYDYLYFSGNFANHFGNRKLLVLDEAHNFESKMMNLVGEVLSRRSIVVDTGLDIFQPIANGTATLKSAEEEEYWIGMLDEIIRRYKDKVPKTPKEEVKIKSRVNRLMKLKDSLQDDENRWVIMLPTKTKIVDDRDFSAKLNATFKPLTVRNYTDELLHFGECRLFLTGTLGDKDSFCRWNGLESDETYYISCKSPFHVDNRPLYKKYAGSMSFRNIKNTTPKALDIIRDILDVYDDVKGVIHTSSYPQAFTIKNALGNRIMSHTQKNRESVIREFEESDGNKVLVSPSVKDGVDFKGDKCRFQIIYKVPFPSLADKQVNIRKHYDDEWYAYYTIMPLMQAYGRGVRSNNDYCDTFILDSDFERLSTKHRKLFNEYFLEAVHAIPSQTPISAIRRNRDGQATLI